MPGIYEGVCRECDHKTGWMAGGYGAILVDRPLTETPALQERFITIQTTDVPAIDEQFRLVILSHPGETDILQRTGYTWNDLRRQGRYVVFAELICRRCGLTYDRRGLADPEDAGCAAAIVLQALRDLLNSMREDGGTATYRIGPRAMHAPSASRRQLAGRKRARLRSESWVG